MYAFDCNIPFLVIIFISYEYTYIYTYTYTYIYISRIQFAGRHLKHSAQPRYGHICTHTNKYTSTYIHTYISHIDIYI